MSSRQDAVKLVKSAVKFLLATCNNIGLMGTMYAQDMKELAERLDTARLQAAPIGQISNTVEDFSRRDAYSIQELGTSLREGRGEKVVGIKMGLTSEGKRRQMNLDSPLYGVLTDQMEIQRGVLSLEGLIHPKGEPELAFFVERELSGRITREEALHACREVYPCIEVLDSRYKQFKYFSMEDVIADNSSSSHFILGPKNTHFDQLDLADLKMTFRVDGKIAEEGSSRAISGDPVLSIVQLSELLAERGKSIPPGTIVLAGAATAAVSLTSKMKLELEVEGFSSMALQIES